MDKKIAVLKGIHPGLVLKHELFKRGMAKGKLALAVKEYPQTIGAIISGKRNMNTALSLKIEKELSMEEGYLMTLQLYYDIKKVKESSISPITPNLNIIDKSTFWDTDIKKIDWQKYKGAIIARVEERGSEEERTEIRKFYGSEVVNRILSENAGANKHRSMPLPRRKK